MKKIFTLLLVSSSLASFAQTQIHFLTGLSGTTFNTDLMSDFGFDGFRQEYIDGGGSTTTGVNNSFRQGGYGAVEVDFFLSEKLFIKSGVKYMTSGDSYNFSTDDIVSTTSTPGSNTNTSETDEKRKWRPRLDYFAIPANIGTYLSDEVSVYGGVTAGILASNILKKNKFEGSSDDLQQKWDKQDSPVDASSVVVFLDAGINYALINDESAAVTLDVRVNYSMNSVYDDSKPANNGLKFNDAKSIIIELGMGIVLKK